MAKQKNIYLIWRFIIITHYKELILNYLNAEYHKIDTFQLDGIVLGELL